MGANLPDGPPEPQPGTPRWVKVIGVIIVVVAIALAVSMLLGVEHGPGMHGAAQLPRP